jgi:hypothetical protein
VKQIAYAGGSLITGNDVAAALLKIVPELTRSGDSVSVDIPVLESNGKTSTHTLLLAPGMLMDVTDVDGLDPEEERERFPAPKVPPIGMVAAPADSNAGEAILDEGILHADLGQDDAAPLD